MAESNANSGYVDDWQRGKSVIECNLHMWNTGEACDVTFRVGEVKEDVHAHKYVLISRSCVFSAMFCGPLAEKGKVTIPDIEPSVFREFLLYLYSDNADVKSDNVTGLLYISRKYAIDALYKKCIHFLDKFLSEGNICDILEQSQCFGETDLEEKALDVLSKAGKNVVQSPGFLSLSPYNFKKFLKSEELKLKEEEVFASALEWAKEQCRIQNKEPSSANLRNMLGDLLYEIRFPAMPMEYIVKVVGPSGILTSDERISIVDKIVDPTAVLTTFKTWRNPSKMVRMKNVERRLHTERTYGGRRKNVTRRFTSYPYFTSRACVGKVDAIMFSTSEDIELLGCQLYGPICRSESTYTVSIKVLDEQQVISTPMSDASITLTHSPPINDVMFPAPVEIRRNNMYTLSVSMLGENAGFGLGGRQSVVTEGVTFTFRDSPLSTTDTNTKQGQIPGLIWR